MTIDLAPLKAKVIEEINLLPGEKLLDIFNQLDAVPDVPACIADK